jgi:hypothetical protein
MFARCARRDDARAPGRIDARDAADGGSSDLLERVHDIRVVCAPPAMKLDFLWAGLCLLGAVYIMFRT